MLLPKSFGERSKTETGNEKKEEEKEERESKAGRPLVGPLRQRARARGGFSEKAVNHEERKANEAPRVSSTTLPRGGRSKPSGSPGTQRTLIKRKTRKGGRGQGK